MGDNLFPALVILFWEPPPRRPSFLEKCLNGLLARPRCQTNPCYSPSRFTQTSAEGGRRLFAFGFREALQLLPKLVDDAIRRFTVTIKSRRRTARPLEGERYVPAGASGNPSVPSNYAKVVHGAHDP